jgi:hypothetical protein
LFFFAPVLLCPFHATWRYGNNLTALFHPRRHTRQAGLMKIRACQGGDLHWYSIHPSWQRPSERSRRYRSDVATEDEMFNDGHRTEAFKHFAVELEECFCARDGDWLIGRLRFRRDN